MKTRTYKLKRRQFKLKLVIVCLLILVLGSFWYADAYFGKRQLSSQRGAIISQTMMSLDSFEQTPIRNHDNLKFLKDNYRVHHNGLLTYVPLSSLSLKWTKNQRLWIQKYRLYNFSKSTIPSAMLLQQGLGINEWNQRQLRRKVRYLAGKQADFNEFVMDTHADVDNWSQIRYLRAGQSVDLVVLTVREDD